MRTQEGFSQFDTDKAPKQENTPPKNSLDTKTILKHFGLFLLTFASVTYVGINWVGQTAVAEDIWDLVFDGMLYAALLLTFLGTHEFGHYFAAVYHNIRTSLPYFIPLPLAIGTMGAVIRIKERMDDSKKLFDIGISGPLVGFVVSLIILLYGFATLPGPEFITNFAGHDEVIAYVQEHGAYPETIIEVSGKNSQTILLGNTLLYDFLASFFDNVPPMWEMYHYPFLFAGWLGLFFTALNLTPVGQLDGGHILYALIGFKKHRIVARLFFIVLIGMGSVGALPFIHQNLLSSFESSYGLLSWAVLGVALYFIIRKAFRGHEIWTGAGWIAALSIAAFLFYFVVGRDQASGFTVWFVWSLFLTFLVGVEHPPAQYERKLDPVRTGLGWFSMAIFVLCISPSPMYLIS